MKKRKGLNKFLKNRRALSAVIITLIMIALALVLVAVVWVVVSNLIKGQTEGISLEKLTFDAEIKEVGINNSTNNLTLTIQRKAGQGEITGMKFVFENSTDKEISTLYFTLIELGKKRFEFHLNIPVDSISKISIVPLFQSSSGEETIGNVVDSYSFKGGESGAYVPVVPCTPDCTGKECGNDGCDGSCGTCSSGYTCNASGMCTSSNVTSCTPTTCAALGYECGTAANGTCAGTLSCGTCSSGYSCVGGSCVEQVSADINGVAPLSVHFFSNFVDSASGSERIDRFHHYDYTWNFGDTGSGNWGTDGKPKNIEKGAVTTHIFEEPGNYNVTLTIRDDSGVVGTESYTISVTDPDLFYSGTNTICVNGAGDTSFSGCPSGALTISTDDISTITQYATPGRRILFKRGSSWTTTGLTWPTNAGPVIIGAYGTGTNPDALGIYGNAPQINVNWGDFLALDEKQNWTIMDIHLVDITPGRNSSSFTGTTGMQRLLLLRLKTEGFHSGVSISHWNNAEGMQNNEIVIASCDISDSYMENIYIGGQRLAVMGNNVHDNIRSHVLRIWHAYHGVVEHNLLSGACYDSEWQQGALKFHGPKEENIGTPTPGTLILTERTEYAIISDNVFGQSGPWPVGIGPQNPQSDERVSNVIFERNRLIADYGTPGTLPVGIHLHIWSQYTTVRNNILDGTGSGNSYYGIMVDDRGIVPPQTGVEIYDNTIYRGDSASSTHMGLMIWEEVTSSIVRNNLVSFPYATGSKTLIDNDSTDLISSNNLLADNPNFVDPNNVNPLSRDFSVGSGSITRNAGTTVPVFEDFEGTSRPQESIWDVGAYEYV